MNFEDMIYDFIDNHPGWTWILARLVICICGCAIATMCFFALLVLATPFVHIQNGAGWEAFATWLWLPLIATAIWVLGSIIILVWDEVIE